MDLRSWQRTFKAIAVSKTLYLCLYVVGDGWRQAYCSQCKQMTQSCGTCSHQTRRKAHTVVYKQSFHFFLVLCHRSRKDNFMLPHCWTPKQCFSSSSVAVRNRLAPLLEHKGSENDISPIRDLIQGVRGEPSYNSFFHPANNWFGTKHLVCCLKKLFLLFLSPVFLCPLMPISLL